MLLDEISLAISNQAALISNITYRRQNSPRSNISRYRSASTKRSCGICLKASTFAINGQLSLFSGPLFLSLTEDITNIQLQLLLPSCTSSANTTESGYIIRAIN